MSNLTLKVGAEITDLVTKMALAKSSVGDYGAALRKLASQAVAAGDGMDAGLKSKLESAAVALYQEKQNVAALSAELRDLGNASSAAAELHEGFLGGLARSFEGVNATAERFHSSLSYILKGGEFLIFKDIADQALGAVQHAFEETVGNAEEFDLSTAKFANEMGITQGQAAALAQALHEVGASSDDYAAIALTRISHTA